MEIQGKTNWSLGSNTSEQWPLIPPKKSSILSLFFSSFFLEHTEEGCIRHSDASWTVCTLSCSTSPQCHVPQTFCSIAAHHFTIALVDAQLKVKAPHRPRRAHQPLDKLGERIPHLSTHWDNDGVRQRVCGSLSQTQTHPELAGLWRWGALYLAASGRWSLNRDVTVGSAQSESRCVHVYVFLQQLVLSLNTTSFYRYSDKLKFQKMLKL